MSAGRTAAAAVSTRWSCLLRIAQEEVRTTLEALPAPLRSQAAPLPVSCEPVPNEGILADDYDPDLLGLFIGPPLAEPEASPLPPQIILFLENIWDFAEEDEEIYREEVRTTYLHELGHYLGLDEIDLEERGLD
jgi:predicted Zn-dependent protease with MMP-like domain